MNLLASLLICLWMRMHLLTADTDFHELDSWSSLTSLSVVAMIIQEYGVELDSLDVRNADTIEELFEIVKSRIK